MHHDFVYRCLAMENLIITVDRGYKGAALLTDILAGQNLL